MRIYVGGSLRNVPREAEQCKQFVAALGAEVARGGHTLLNGCRSSLDREIATAASTWITENTEDDLDARVMSYVIQGDEPIHRIGAIRYSSLADWEMNHPQLVPPEQIAGADIAIFVAGSNGTFWARNWAEFARKPILGIPRFGGAAETIYNQRLAELRTKAPDTADEYETLNSISDDIADLARRTVRFAARLVAPENVFSIMSFQDEYIDVFDSYQDVCREFDFTAMRVDESSSLERIVPRIEAGLRNSAFVLADVSEASPNVYYELGFAKGMSKPVIVTAKAGTELPFDVTDVPTVFWSTQRELKEELRIRLEGVVKQFGR